MVEKADGTLQTLLRQKLTNYEIKSILFQLLYTFKIIQKRFNDFIHNDLKPNNVLYFNPVASKKDMYYEYELDGNVYYLPNTYQIALWDFGFSSITCENCDNLRVESLLTTQILGIQTEKNHYKDIFKFFHILKKSYSIFFDNVTKIFIDKYLYKTESIDGYENLLPNIEPFTIEEMLSDTYFDILKIKKDKIIERYSDENVYNKDLSRFVGIFDTSDELKFNCNAYEKDYIAYFTYRLPSLNNPYRMNCFPSIEEENYLTENDDDFLSVACGKEVKTKLEYKEALINFGKREIVNFNNLIKKDEIVDLYTDLLTQFTRYTYVHANQRIMSSVLRLVILNKAVFIVTKYHYPLNINESRLGKYLDYLLQFNEFLCKNLI